MDENPDNITIETAQGPVSVINFAKRKMVYNVISLVQQYPFNFLIFFYMNFYLINYIFFE